jgi:hypothetical protein
MNSIYVMASGKDVGKTTVSLGLLSLLREKGFRIGFCKPVGQQYVKVGPDRIDKDAVLMHAAFGLSAQLPDMSPVTVPRGFVEEYIFKGDNAGLRRRIAESFARVAEGCDIVVVEGTGHAGVGSCFGLSNATVASLLGSRVLMVAEGGIGSTIDQVALNYGLFRNTDVEILGVLANKVLPEKIDRIRKALDRGLGSLGLDFLGAMPFDATLTFPRMRQVAETLSAEVLGGEGALPGRAENFIIAAMEPQHVLERIKTRSMVITPGDRVDNIMVALNAAHQSHDAPGKVVGLILTGGLRPPEGIVTMLCESGLPVLLSTEDTFEVSAKIQNMGFKIQPDDTGKIEEAKRLVRENLDIDRLLAHKAK